MKYPTRFVLTIALALLAGVMLYTRVAAEKATSQSLGGEERYLTSITTDKPIYRTGEKVYVRGVLLNAANHLPLPAAQQAQAMIEVKGPKGDTVSSGWTQTQDSVWSFSWEVPAAQAGGEYTIKASYPSTGHTPAERKFDIRAYRAPRLKSQIAFLRDGYGPGEKVSATLHTERAEGGIPEGAKVSVIARVDGVEIHGVDCKVDGSGNCTASFDLPKEIARGEGTLALVIEDGGVVETASKTLPILLQTLDIKFYPEGGDLIAGLPNHVYFEARQPNGKPADFEGEIMAQPLEMKELVEPVSVSRVSTEHEGRGRFEFAVDARMKYWLHVAKPCGIKTQFDLPMSKATGVSLWIPDATYHHEPVTFCVACAGIENIHVTLSKREKEIDSVAVNYVKDRSLKDGAPYAWKRLDPKEADGILRVTVWDDNGVPLAERLVYREPSRKLNITVTPEKKIYVPGDTAKLTLKATDSDGKPVSAVIGLTATDDSVLQLIERREQAPRLPAMVLLEDDVKELADAQVYLDPKNPKAPLAMDLLLGTQGWRRFAFMDAPKLIKDNGDKALRVLAYKAPPTVRHRGEWVGGACFIAGTPVMTEKGERAIQTLSPGDKVYSCDPDVQPWSLLPVTKLLRHEYEGDVITLEVHGVQVRCTGNHPFWVMSGTDLPLRPAVSDLSPRDNEMRESGRWVEARDLRTGDQLITLKGAATIERVSARHEHTTVWNITVSQNHTYTVSIAGILVHNKDAVNAPGAIDELDGAEFGAPMDRAGAAKPEAAKAAAPPMAQPAKNEAPEPPQKVMQLAIEQADAAQDKRALLKNVAEARMLRRRQELVFVREYAHTVRADRKPGERADFTETVYWNAGIKTDEKTGEAVVSFALNDSVTSFRIFADGFGNNGALGASESVLDAVQPFYVEPKLPLEVTSGDTILLPINVVNSIDSSLDAELRAELKGEFKIGTLPPFDLKPMARQRQILKIDVGFNNGPQDFVLSADARPYSDKVTRKLNVKPKGFPIEVPWGGMIGADSTVAHSITIPDAVVPRSLTAHVAVYPTPLANMTEALQRMIQDPYGCFEQTSSTSYPLTMAQQYFMSHTGVDPKLIEQSREKLDAGYKRLTGFWCPDRGYEWFGENPGHEALTAFGILHFTDMAQVREVDQNMITTTRAWLMKQRDGKGGFERKRRALHTWIEDKDCSNAYILWALLESGEKAENLSAEVAALKTAAAQSQNSYVLALASSVFSLAGDKAEAAKLMEKLSARQNNKGEIEGGTASIVGSGGETLAIETTALATLAWLREPNFAGNVEKSMKYLADSCKAGRFGSTQSTVLALRAIVAYDKQRARPKAPGKVRLFVDGQSIGGPVSFDQSTQGAIALPDMSELLGKGEHKIELKMEGGGEMPYSIAVNYNALTPASSNECKLGIDVHLANTEIAEGGATEANVTVTNKTQDVLPTPVAIVGLPGGLEPRHDQLKELVKKGTVDAYEVIGRELVLYWRTLPAGAKVSVPLSLIAAIPGTYSGPASRAYLYYTDEHKQWVAGLKATITPK